MLHFAVITLARAEILLHAFQPTNNSCMSCVVYCKVDVHVFTVQQLQCPVKPTIFIAISMIAFCNIWMRWNYLQATILVYLLRRFDRLPTAFQSHEYNNKFTIKLKSLRSIGTGPSVSLKRVGSPRKSVRPRQSYGLSLTV